jgi:hypothetical protein
MNAADIISMVRLRGVLNAVSHTETLAAADLNGGTDTAREIRITPAVGAGGGQFVLLYRIQAQGIRPSNLTIDVQDLNRSSFRVLLPPELVFADDVFIGDSHEGVILRVRNDAAKAVPLTLHLALVNQRQLEQLIAAPADTIGAHSYARIPAADVRGAA